MASAVWLGYPRDPWVDHWENAASLNGILHFKKHSKHNHVKMLRANLPHKIIRVLKGLGFLFSTSFNAQLQQMQVSTKRDLHHSMEGCAWSVDLFSAITQIHGERIVSFLEGSTNASEEELSFQDSKHVLWPKAILGNCHIFPKDL